MGKAAWWAAGIVAAVVAAVHLAVAGRYGAFGNELYFIVCGRHPGFGYVDQPPLVPLLAAVTQLAGINLWLLRLPAVAAAIAIVPLTVAFARLFGASARGAWIAAVAAAASPLDIAMTATLSTSTFEALDFTAIAYLVTRGFLRSEPRAYWWAGAVAGIAFETKYGIAMWLAGIAAGLLAAGPRSIFRSRDLWIGVGIAVLIALPNAIWQAANGFPFLELVRNDNAGNFTGGPLFFALDQMFTVNFVLAPLWIAGIVAPFAIARLAAARYLAIAFLASAAIILITHGKSYYLAGAYPALFAIGAAAVTNLRWWFVGLWALIAAANAALALPLALPVLPPAKLQAMIEHMSFRPRAVERACVGAPITCIFSDEFGWPELARSVENVYAALPPRERVQAAIFASNYREAAAIDVYAIGLPPAISASNQYYLWGARGYDGSVVVAINADPVKWSSMCDSLQVAARFGTSPYSMPYERDRPIFICRGMHPPLARALPEFKYYGVENLGKGP